MGNAAKLAVLQRNREKPLRLLESHRDGRAIASSLYMAKQIWKGDFG
jgi:hypothetical protein